MRDSTLQIELRAGARKERLEPNTEAHYLAIFTESKLSWELSFSLVTCVHKMSGVERRALSIKPNVKWDIIIVR